MWPTFTVAFAHLLLLLTSCLCLTDVTCVTDEAIFGGVGQKSGPDDFWRLGLFVAIPRKSRGGPFFVK